MIRRVALLTLMALAVITQNIIAYIGSLTHYRKGAKKVLVIGDWHFQNKADKRDFGLLKQLIADLSKQHKPVCWMHEGNPDIYHEWKYTPDQATVTALLCNAYYHQLSYGCVRFDLVDPRHYASRIFTDLLDYCSGLYADKELAEYYNTPDQKYISETKRAYADTMSEPDYVKELIHEIDDVLGQLKQIKPLVAPRALKIIEPLRVYLSQAKTDISRFFKNKSKQQLKRILDSALVNSSHEPLGNLILTRDALLSDMADAGFIAHFLRNELHYDTFVFFIGDYHTININEVLEAQGYHKENQKGEWLDMAIEKKPFSRATITKFFDQFSGVASNKKQIGHKIIPKLFEPMQFISNQVGKIVCGRPPALHSSAGA